MQKDPKREVALEFGKRFFLLPERVVNIVRYWISNYTDFEEEQEGFFLSLIAGLLENPVRLEISASESLATRQSTEVKYQAILQFVGTAYHRIPLAYFAKNYDFPVFNLMSSLTDPDQNFFLQRTAPGLDGEIHMSSFYYDPLLNEYYDPFLFIITAFIFHMHSLINSSITSCRVKEDWLPRHFYSLRALNEESLERIACFPRDNNGGRTDRLRKELRTLYHTLHTDDIHKAIEDCTQLFERKATESFSLLHSPVTL